MRFTNDRRGASLIVVLALLAVCTTILLQLLSAGLQQRFQMRRDLQREQTQWLLRAGDAHAAIELKNNKGKLPDGFAVELPGFDSAKLSFATDSESSNPATMKVSAQIGRQDSPSQLTVLSSELKIPSNIRKSNQE